MRSPLSRRVAVLPLAAALAASLAAGCASGGHPSSDAGRTRAPVLRDAPRPAWVYPPAPRTGTVLDLQIEILVDSTGRADRSTLRVVGIGAAENRDAAATWLGNARFTPAQRDGKPVAGVYRTRARVRAEARTEVRRVGAAVVAPRPFG